ncbi:MAG: hypothetical protein ACREJO_14620 [Phycisphaerales bacterium]
MSGYRSQLELRNAGPGPWKYATKPPDFLNARQTDYRSEIYANGMFVYGPLYPGLILNTVFSAAILWAIFLGPDILLRTLRRRANRCANCGYNLDGLPVAAAPTCPECGHNLASTVA